MTDFLTSTFDQIETSIAGSIPGAQTAAANAVQGAGAALLNNLGQAISPSAGVVVPVSQKNETWLILGGAAVLFLILFLALK